MEKELIKQITRLVIKKLEEHKELSIANESETSSNNSVDSFSNNIPTNDPPTDSGVMHSVLEIEEPSRNVVLGHACKEEILHESMKKTPARIGIGRAGVRPKTEAWLRFRLDHAAAVDAVYGDVNETVLNKLGLFKVSTKVSTKEEFIRRPDLGRKLTEESKNLISSKCVKGPQVQIIVSDGLSSDAIEKNIEDVYLSFEQSLKSYELTQGTPFYIEKGRVAVMDEIGELLQPEVIVLFIGERPGLVSSESLSAYLCYKPNQNTIEADRMVVSNIHSFGIPPVEAGAYLGKVVKKILTYEASGVNLVKKQK
ncbi:ethanolamine ammonia-lyase subunit EutC [Alkalihalobacterium elongatum]|uniref:ethanolamine ammonia-lyase subunit EutC n=1 Tax=Alkalihalobacterium elongatum TaxID=2675466 RepID=UPI001C1F63C2|nr:ethanolamine ammonia-lyase subunit EutC [Alkalihalobacterium elongatum]